MTGIYRHFNKDTDTAINSHDDARKHTGLNNDNQNYGGTAGANDISKADKGDLKENKVMDDVKNAYDKYLKK